MSGSETVDPEQLDALARKIASTLGPLFDSASEKFEDTEVGGPSFSTYGAGLQAIYPTVQEFGIRDLQTKSQNVASIIERLGSTARTWHSAEGASTVQVTGGPARAQ